VNFFVLARVSDANHHPWLCIEIETDFATAFAATSRLDQRPGVETSIVEESALTLQKRNEYRRHLARRAA
jgi:hypothetical protein